MSWAERYKAIRHRTEEICAPLNPEDMVPQPQEYVSPPKWHMAHTTWFFEEMILKPFVEGYQIFHKDFSYLFNSYYNFVGERTLRADRGNMTRPTVEDILKFRSYVNKHMIALLETEVSDEIEERLVLGLNHEQQHQELILTDLKHLFSFNPLYPIYKDRQDNVVSVPKLDWIEHGQEVVEIGSGPLGASIKFSVLSTIS